MVDKERPLRPTAACRIYGATTIACVIKVVYSIYISFCQQISHQLYYRSELSIIYILPHKHYDLQWPAGHM